MHILCITTGTSVTVYMFVHTFLCIYAKSLLLMARAANLLSLHFLLAFKYLSLHSFFNNIQCWSNERSGCTLTFTDVESVCTILLMVVFNSIHTQVHGFKWTHEGMPQTKSPANGCVNIIWRGHSIRTIQSTLAKHQQCQTVFNFQSPLSASAGQKSMN